MGIDTAEQRKLYTRAHLLAILTIYYNLVEGIVSVWAGASDETLALFGFGVDSFIEVISAIGVWHMIRRIRANNGETKDAFEQRALRITGGSFYVLTAGLVVMAIMNIYQQHKPDTTFWGIVISLLSISFMWLLIHYKTKVGKALNSSAILADAACSRACVYLSVVLLVASVGFELTGLGYLDAIGALLIAWFAWKEGRESFDKAKGLNDSCGCCRV
ncbi:cation transporter [Geobacter sulfurreducens subsp. ethanolicus]|uniref:Cation transporter n=1 Tax=Geomobilimonas luticola TaxID=1114878 RepID=A0ABS5SAU4_9BACT|nr:MULTISPECIES: cation transporter [Geobacteraceae]MBT0652498.1 cation transporter [Geomobilimonas luticola]BEH08990.1 cation transporter [Geobacter sulfurreducens subsp. ethanolicus]